MLKRDRLIRRVFFTAELRRSCQSHSSLRPPPPLITTGWDVIGLDWMIPPCCGVAVCVELKLHCQQVVWARHPVFKNWMRRRRHQTPAGRSQPGVNAARPVCSHLWERATQGAETSWVIRKFFYPLSFTKGTNEPLLTIILPMLWSTVKESLLSSLEQLQEWPAVISFS